jgi:hypothetical protein
VKKSIIREVPGMSWATGAWGVWWLALAVTYGTVTIGALAHGDWRPALAWEAVQLLARGVFFGWVAYVFYDNARLRRHPMWAHVDKAWQDGYFAATRANGVVR